jgi:hypothetical protein
MGLPLRLDFTSAQTPKSPRMCFGGNKERSIPYQEKPHRPGRLSKKRKLKKGRPIRSPRRAAGERHSNAADYVWVKRGCPVGSDQDDLVPG